MDDLESLRVGYQDVFPRAERLKNAVIAELQELFHKHGVSLGVPIESRVKTWSSITDKIDRKGAEISSIVDLSDLIGIRVILLFKKDLDSVRDIVAKNFELISSEDTGERLSESEFGYQSHHYIVKIPSNWLSVPTWAGFGGFSLELQVRTMAQHIWAAASHKLQYKQESGVPHPIRRTINRVSALLETVDLELQRVLDERVAYKEHASDAVSQKPSIEDELNVDNLSVILSEVFPSINKHEFEDYSDLLSDMFALGVTTRSQAIDIFKKNYAHAMAEENRLVQAGNHDFDDEPDFRPAGVYFKHVGLAREALRGEFGSSAVSEAKKARRS
jgi:ppGpp synthetase/RelA/SpoT-type nucleotidyltranferase